MKWVESPEFLPDSVNHISNCVAFLICTQDIEFGVEMRWKYPFVTHMSPKQSATISGAAKALAAAKTAAAQEAAAAKDAAAAKTAAAKASTASQSAAVAKGVSATKTAAAKSSATAAKGAAAAKTAPAKNVAAAKDELEPRDEDPDCLCDGNKCKLGFCWYLNGRVVAKRFRHASPKF